MPQWFRIDDAYGGYTPGIRAHVRKALAHLRKSLKRGLMLLASVAALFATGWAAWLSSLASRLNHQAVWGILGEALEYALLAWAWSAAIALVLYLLIPRPRRVDVLPAALRTSITAVWFAPATILLTAFSPYALVAAIALVISATRLLHAQWRQIFGAAESAVPAAVPEPVLFYVPPAPPLLKELAPALIVSALAQAGGLALLVEYPLLASAFFAMAGATLTLVSLVLGLWESPRPAGLPRSILGVAMTILLATGLTVGGLAVRGGGGGSQWDWLHHSRPGLIESARAWLRYQLYGEKPEAEEAGTRVYAPPAGGDRDITDEVFPGVILWPEVQPVSVLVAPLPALGQGLFNPNNPRPFSFPFAGEYWIFKAPNVRPPQNSHLQRGTPSRVSFRSTDGAPLRMAARHRLEQPVDLRCCREIRLEILNADRVPSTVELELILADTSRTPEIAESLGRAAVRSAPDLSRDPVRPVPENLSFAVPRDSGLRRFDEIRIVFHRDGIRIARSARISIERFTLVPR